MTQHMAAQYTVPDKLQARIDTHQRYTVGANLEEAVDAALGLTGGETLLDIGCGSGAFLGRLQAGGHQGPLTGLDQSAGMLAQAQANAPAAKLVRGDAENLPFPEATFDVVTARHMLYHVPDIARALAEAWRVLKPGGTFLAVTNASAYMQEWYVPFGVALRDIRGQHPDAGRFTELNAPGYVREQFGNVAMTVLESALIFPQAADTLPYFRSLFDEEMPSGAEDRFLAAVQERCGAQGWRVDKQIVLLRAQR